MSTTTSTNLSSGGEYARHLDPTGARYDVALKYLTALAHAESKRRPRAQTVPTGPEFVRDVMVTGVVSAHEDAVFKEIVDALARNRISAVPVVNDQHQVIGVVSESDLLARVSGSHVDLPKGHRHSARAEQRTKVRAATARELMTSPAVCTTPDTHIADASKQAADARVRRLPVVDGHGVLLGIVARAELLRPFLRPDEEICEDILQNVVVGAFVMDRRALDIHVDEGVVTLVGHVERPVSIEELVDSVRAVSGVVDVDDAGLTNSGRARSEAPPHVPLY